jgi:hypothetical protein
LAARVRELRESLKTVPPELLAERTGSSYQAIVPGKGEFHLSFFDKPVQVTYPGMVAMDTSDEDLPLHYQAVLAYYFATSDAAPLTGKWISFAEMPDGRTYNPAFQGYSGDILVKAFGSNLEAFTTACERNGGVATPMGDAAFIFYALPRLPLLVNYWCGDEDFPSNCKILFDRSARHYLPTDVCAIVGGMLARRLAKSGT